MRKNFNEEIKELEKLKRAIERADAAGDYERARALTEELIELDNELCKPSEEDVLEWQGYYNK
jgi:hypothetical protein